MSESNPIRLFVTHAFDESGDYLRVFEFLESARDFFYLNVSKPEESLPGDPEAIRERLRLQIKPAEIVVALGSLGRGNEDLLGFQMTYAQAIHRPVLLVPSFGGNAWLPPKLTDMATEIGEWDSRALVDATRRLARGEDTTRFDTIEFKLDD